MNKIIEIAEQVFRIDSGVHGVNFAVTGGVHGNELTGIAVVRRLVEDFRSGILQLEKGTLTLALCNLRAIDQNTRGSEPLADLNRCFSSALLSGSQEGYEFERARELAFVFEDVEIGLDLHATNKPCTPFLYCQPMPTAAHARMYRWLDVSAVLVDPLQVFGKGIPVALDEYFGQNGGVGLCYETGNAQDLSRVETVRSEVLHILRDQGLLGGTVPGVSVALPQLYELTEELLFPVGGNFVWSNGLGEYNFQPFALGQEIYVRNGVSYLASHDGVILFPKPVNLIAEGYPVGYLARLM